MGSLNKTHLVTGLVTSGPASLQALTPGLSSPQQAVTGISEFQQLVAAIQRQGYDEPAAAELAALIGDTPIIDEDGSVIVMEQGRVIARLRPLHFFDGNCQSEASA